MNTKVLSGILFALAAAPALADDVDIQNIAARTGLSERQVKMVYGPSTAYPEYRTSYDFARERVDEAILEDQLHPAVTIGEVATAAPSKTTTTTTTTYSDAETLPYDESNPSSDQLRSSSDEDENEYDDDSD